MSIAPSEGKVSTVVPGSIELLIKEAQRASRRRRLRNALVLSAVLLLIVGAIVFQIERSGSFTPKPATSAPNRTLAVTPACSIGQLSITSIFENGAGGTDGGILLFRNITAHPCSLTGYPIVVATGQSKATITASHFPNGMLGGWDLLRVTPVPKPPTVVLANKGDVASDWYQYGENGPEGYTLFLASSLSVRLAGSRSVVHVRGSVDAAEGKMWVTPFVPGETGTAEPRTKH